MSSSKIYSATPPSVVGGSNPYGNTYKSQVNSGGSVNIGPATIGNTYNSQVISNGRVNISPTTGIGSVTISANEIKAVNSAVVDNSSRMTASALSGDPVIQFFETQADGMRVKATFEPDTGMSSVELSRILMLIVVMSDGAAFAALKPISFIRKHSLERHFRFSTA